MKTKKPTLESQEVNQLNNQTDSKGKNYINSFWEYDHKHKLEINYSSFYKQLTNLGYRKTFPSEGQYKVVRIVDGIASYSSNADIKDTLKQILDEDFPEMFEEIMNLLIINEGKLFSIGSKEFLPTLDGEFLKDNQNSVYLTFQNGYVEITNESIELKEYSELGGKLVWSDQILNHEIVLTSHQNESFDTFLRTICKDDDRLYETITTSLEYCISSFKNKSIAKSIVICDKTNPSVNEPNGGTGKSLIAESIKYVRNQAFIDGKGFNPSNQFAFQRINEQTKSVLLDDVKQGFDFERLFTLISNDFIGEKKYKDSFAIPFLESPKVIITTNFTISQTGFSYDRRKIEIPLPRVFNKTFTPYSLLGQNMFHDWNSYQWNSFYNSMFSYTLSFQKNGIVEYNDFADLTARKIIETTSPDFYDFINGYFELGKKYNKKNIFEDFIMQFQDNAYLKQRTFTIWLNNFASHHNYSVTESKSGNTYYIVIDDIKNQQ